MNQLIKVGFCVAYDWELLKTSLPLVYTFADAICLSIDKNRVSWSGKSYKIDESAFKTFLETNDPDKKIDLYEDNFYLPNLNAIENDNYQRNSMAARMGKGGWHIQVDCDEYFVDFGGFCSYLKKFGYSQKEINVCCPWLSVFKEVEHGYLYIPVSERSEFMPFATNKPNYTNARRNGYFNHLTPFLVVHNSWARDLESLKRKLSSWGHVDDFNIDSYLKLWEALDQDNYHYIKNFHPINSLSWPELKLAKAGNIEELLSFYQERSIDLNSVWFQKRNSRFLAKLKSVLNG